LETDEALRLVTRIYTRIIARRPTIETREQYHRGDQPLNFATKEWKDANASRYKDFSDNWCRPVVDAEGERIRHTGIKLPGGKDKAAGKLWNQWLANEMEMQSSQGFITTLVADRSFVLVWGTNGDEPIVTWEHPSSVEIEYDWENPRLRKAALKTWADDTTEFATLYTPEELWKFERPRFLPEDERQSQTQQGRVRSAENTGWVPRLVDQEPWPIVNPMGVVPIVEIPNRPMLGNDPLSEIQGVMPMQDAINLLWAYLFLSADYASMPARVVLGQGPPMVPVLDSNGIKIGDRAVDIKELAEKRILYMSGKETKIDSWEAAKLDVFGDVIEMAVGHIAAQTRTPPTYLVSKTGMSNVNGTGLKASEIGLVKKTLEFQLFATPAIREVYRLMALAMGETKLARRTKLATITWMNPEIRSEAELADMLVKKAALGYPLEYLMELDGLDPRSIERVMEMVKAEREDPQLTAAMRELSTDANPAGDQ